MKSHWFSRRGLGRDQNGDVGAVLQRPAWLLAVVMDHCAESDPSLGKNWCRSLTAALELDNAPSAETLKVAMKAAWVAELKGSQRYRAAVAGLLLNHATQEAFAVVAGDCRIGQLSPSGKQVRWLTPVHTTAKFLAGSEEQASHSHTLTRCLKERRFPLVEVISLPYHSSDWILATDGYWNASVGLDIERHSPLHDLPHQTDDHSCLLLSELLGPNLVGTDSDNFCVYTLLTNREVPSRR